MSDDGSIGSFADFGADVRKSSTTKRTWIGKIRSVSSFSKLEKAFGVTSLVSLAAICGITIYKLATTSTSSADFTFGVVLLLNTVFCTYYILNGIFFERPYEIGIFVLATCCAWSYLILNYVISVKGPLKLSRLVVASVLSPCVIVMGVLIAKNYNESKSLIFRTVGAQTELQDSCSTMFVFFGLLKADLQISMSLALLILTSPDHLTLTEIILLPLALVLGVSHFWSGYFSVRLENRYIFIMWGVFWLFMPAFAGYLIFVAVKDLSWTADNTKMEISLYAVVFVVAASCLLVRGVCLYFSIKVCRNFGKGLKQKVFGDNARQDLPAEEPEDA